jgi:TetR/AcrR family transcriptional regulator, fatty acid metabolism regulator protein
MARRSDPDASELRRNQILDAAMPVFARLGFERARMDDIVEASGLSKGALYWYFKSKEEIITGILRRLFTTDIEQLRGLLEAEGTVSERLLLLTRFRVAGLKRLADLLPILVEFYAVMVRQNWVREFIGEYFGSFRELLVDLIQQGIDRGEFRPVSTFETAVTLSAIYEGLTIHWLINPKVVEWDIIGEGSVRLLLEGLQARL